MKEVLILEDKEESRRILEELVKQVQPDADVYAVSSEDEAYAIAMKRTIDLFLVDIILHPETMGDQSGADFAQNLRTIEKYLFTPIIVITSLYDPKIYMYSAVHCYRFIEKPFDAKKVRETIQEAIKYRTVDEKKRNIIFHVDGLLQMVAVDEIIYIESRKHKLYIKTAEECLYVPYKSCKSMLEELDNDNFVKCNRGTIVNMSYVKKVDSVNRFIYLKGIQDVLEIGPIMKKAFMDKVLETRR